MMVHRQVLTLFNILALIGCGSANGFKSYAVHTSVTPKVTATNWQPPLGVPHPGEWFLKSSGNNKEILSGGTSATFSGIGTAQSPVIFKGVNSPKFTGPVVITGEYVIVDGIEIDGGTLRINGNHLSIRNS
ncbi:MAG: hypothetical protein IT289_04605, partial [Oligoflexia bacterium]|nr:hypothetical protein [Oligoflexia bacterium]